VEVAAAARASDRLVVATAADGGIRAAAVVVSGVIDEARRRQELFPVATAALGRALAGAALLAASLKAGQRLTLRLLGDGPLGGVVADAEPGGDLRGYVKHPRVMLPVSPAGKLDVGRGVGHRGIIHVSRDVGLGTPYVSSAPLVSGEIGADLANFLVRSEQVPSALSLGVLVGRGNRVLGAGGVLVQILPGGEAHMDRAAAGVERMPPVSSLAARGASAEALLEAALPDFTVTVLEQLQLRWHCTCNRPRARRVLGALPPSELAAMAEEDQGAELTCHFCSRSYRFTRDELLRLAARGR
jgi:molecular chaperone Hsp33